MTTTDPVPFGQLVTIARQELEASPWIGIDKAEWSERIRQQLLVLTLASPHPSEITAAMIAVLDALVKQALNVPRGTSQTSGESQT